MKLKKIEIKGFRGVKEVIELNLEGKSCLIYGENGTGKSSIVDAIEWFYYDKIDHLSLEEIDRKGGISAIRNIHLPDSEKSYVNLIFSDDNFNCKKEIDYKLSTNNSNTTQSFKEYIENSQKENLILRYRDLSNFINATKSEKLNYLLNIIGFENVLKIRNILKKSKNEIDRRLRIRNFDNEISRREGEIMQKFGERIVDDNSFVMKVNKIISQLKLQPIASINETKILLEQLKAIDDTPLIRTSDYLEKSKNAIKAIEDKLEGLYACYNEYFSIYKNLIQDIETLKQLSLENLWRAGFEIIQKKIWEEDKCPLCYQSISLNELYREIEYRLTQITEIKKKKIDLENKRNDVQSYLNEFQKEIASIEKSEYFKKDEFEFLRKFVEYLNKWIKDLQSETNKDFLRLEQIKPVEDIKIPSDYIPKVLSSCEKHFEDIQRQLKGEKIIELHSNISLAWERYKEIKQLKKEKEILERYSNSMTQIYNEYIKKLKEELNRFVNMFSGTLNEYYTFMHPGDNISSIQIKLIEEEEEENLNGLTIEYNFYNKLTSPPQKYLSESHINSLGIAFFLTSVKAFNKLNKFFILDDVISSFDTEHRKKLVDLLLEKFSDYQIIILTHEKDWFDLVKNSVKGRGWYINVIKWSNEKGTHFAPHMIDLKTYIEEKIKNNDEIGLGNLIRQYLEGILKNVSEAIEVKMPYRNNERNEQRMCHEMLSYLKSELKKQPCYANFDEILNRLLNNSLFIADKGSHYDNFQPSIGDCKAFWNEVMAFESLFFCSGCEKSISLKYYDKVNKKIRCKCEKLSYDWKE